MHRLLTLLVGFLLVTGCASSSGGPAHVLSGKAPVPVVIARADEAARAGDYRAAVVLYRQAMDREPTADVAYRLGVAQLGIGLHAGALRSLQRAIGLDPDHRGSLERLTVILISRGDAQGARAYAERLLAVDPESWRAHNALGVAADLEGRVDEAMAHYDSAIALHPDSAMLWNNLGFSRYLAGDNETAVEFLDRALRLDPDYRLARYNLALVLARSARYEQAVAVMLSGGDEAHAYADVGYLAYKLGDYEVAETLITKGIQRSSSYLPDAHRNLAAVREAKDAGPSIEELNDSFGSILQRFFAP